MGLNYIPVLGWFINAAFAVCAAVPFWFLWTWCGLGLKYFYFVPEVYTAPPFWDCVGLFIILGFLKWMVPSLANQTQNNTNTGG